MWLAEDDRNERVKGMPREIVSHAIAHCTVFIIQKYSSMNVCTIMQEVALFTFHL
jgi:hypothetical protein